MGWTASQSLRGVSLEPEGWSPRTRPCRQVPPQLRRPTVSLPGRGLGRQVCSLSSGGDAQGLQGNGPEPPSPHPGHAGPGPLALTEATSLFLGLVQSPQGASILLSPEIPPPGSRRPCSLTWPCPCPRWASLLVPTWVREQRGQSGSTRKAGPGSQPRLSPARTPGRGRGIPREESQDLRGHRQAAGCTLHGRQGGVACAGAAARPCVRSSPAVRAQDRAQDVHTSACPGHQSRARPTLPFPALPVARPLGAPEPARPLGQGLPSSPGGSRRAHRLELLAGQPRRGRLGAEGA